MKSIKAMVGMQVRYFPPFDQHTTGPVVPTSQGWAIGFVVEVLGASSVNLVVFDAKGGHNSKLAVPFYQIGHEPALGIEWCCPIVHKSIPYEIQV